MRNDQGPPLWALRLLRHFCPEQIIEEIEGDLVQRYQRDTTLLGRRRATQKFVTNTMSFFRVGILRRRQHAGPRPFLFKYNIKLIFRAIARHKLFAMTNLAGLSMAMAVCLLTTQFVVFEYSFDRGGTNGAKTYRVDLANAKGGVFQQVETRTVPGLGYSLKQEVSGVAAVGRLSGRKTGIVSNGIRGFEQREDNLVMGDGSIIDLLSIEMNNRGTQDWLTQKDQILVSESAAARYFGTIDATGKLLDVSLNGNAPISYTVQGVFKNIPANRYQRFDFLLAIDNEQSWNENWDWSDCSTYLRLNQRTTPSDLKPLLASLVKTHHDPMDGKGDEYLLEPIADIRLHALDGTGRMELVYFFSALSVLILLLAWFNYINFATARFIEKIKDIGVRKLVGSGRGQIFRQVLLEAGVYHTLAFVFALMILMAVWPQLSYFLGDIGSPTLFKLPQTYLASAVFIFVGSVAIGFYPALIMSSLQPVHALKGNIGGLMNKVFLRRSIVTIQLVITTMLISGVIVIHQQISFMRRQNLGIAIDQTLIIREPLITDATSIMKYATLRNELLSVPGVKAVTYASSFPGAEIDWHRADITIDQENSTPRYSSRIVGIGTEFVDAFELKILAGRNLNEAIESDNKAMLMSEHATKMFGFADVSEALGKEVFIGSRKFQVIGVVNNYHYQSLQHELQPLLYIKGYPRNPAYAIKVSTPPAAVPLKAIEQKWRNAYAGNSFDYYFLDDYFRTQYRMEEQLGTLTSAMTSIAIFLSCSGIFGLALYTVSRRTREIGIRKVMGSSAYGIVTLISTEFVRLALLGSIISIPMAWIVMGIWLERFAYRMPFSIWLLAGPVVIGIMLVMASIALQALRASRINPADSMRHE